MDAALLSRAACRNHDPKLWFPGPGDVDDAVQARLICATCPVTAECLAGAQDDGGSEETPLDGIRGGLSLKERRRQVSPEAALERAKRRAGWKACRGCGVLFGPKRSTQRYCLTSCRAAAKARRRWARDARHREHRTAYMVEVRKREAAERAPRTRECAARGCHVVFEPYHGQRYCSPRCRNRQKMRRYREAHWTEEDPMGLHATTIETKGDLELVKIVNRYPSGEVTEAWEVNCTVCTENLINTSREPEARVVLDEPHTCELD